MSRRADLITLALAVAVHAGLAATIARGHVPKRPPPSTVELEFPPSAPTARAAERPAAPPARGSPPAGAPAHRRIALRARPAVPASRPVQAPPAAPSTAPAVKPVFAVAMAGSSEMVMPAGGPSGPAGSAVGKGPIGSGSAAGRGAGPPSGGGGGGPASEAEVATMPDIDTDACGRTIVYPHDAEEAGIEGDVRLRVSLTPEGRVDNVRVLSGLGHGLDREATEALRHRCRFSPAIGKSGRPVAFVIQAYVFHFQLPR
ncbi:MAG TPA: energy transducer TonB [Polyangia bacterium]